MGGDRFQHVGRCSRPCKILEKSCFVYGKPSPIRPLHEQSDRRMAQQLPQCFDGLQSKQASMDWACSLRSSVALPGGRYQGSMGEVKS